MPSTFVWMDNGELGLDLRRMQQLLGHDNLDTTQVLVV